MYEPLISDVASRYGLSGPTVRALFRETTMTMSDESHGGIEGFVDSFRRAGLGGLADSWIGGGVNKPITREQLEAALGADRLMGVADRVGLGRRAMIPAFAYLLPRLVDGLTPDGQLPSDEEIRARITPVFSEAEPALRKQAPRAVAPPRERSISWLTWAAIPALALLAWVLLRPTPATIEPTLVVTNTGDEVTYAGQVHDDEARETILDALSATFGEEAVGELAVDADVRSADWIPQVEELVSALNTPGTEFALTGDSASIGGWLSDVERSDVTEKVRVALGDDVSIAELGDRAVEAARSANEEAAQILEGLDSGEITADDVVAAMNRTVVYFPSGGSEVPDDMMGILRVSADAIRRLPADTRIIVAGHTDDTGDPDGNMALSQARAESVRDVLVMEGVADDMLSVEAYGATRPVADNATEFGRFKNRRIEYALAD